MSWTDLLCLSGIFIPAIALVAGAWRLNQMDRRDADKRKRKL